MMSPSSRPMVPHARGARLLFSAVFIGIFALAPLGARADTEGGQGSIYTAYRQNVTSCTVASPLVLKNVNGLSTTIVLHNEADTSRTVNWRLRKLGGGALTARSANIPGGGSLTITAADLPVADDFSGSFTAEVPAAECTADKDLSAVVHHDSANGDRLSVEGAAVTSLDPPPGDNGPDLWHPAVHNDDMGVNTNLVIQNLNRDSGVTVRVTFRPETGPPFDVNQTIPADSATSVDLSTFPKGFMAAEIDGPGSANVVSTAYHMGTIGIAAANNAFPTAATDDRVFLPLIFKKGGFDGGYDSVVVVQKVDSGSVTPKITFRDRDTNDVIGPITATKSIREGESMRWDISMVEQLKDNRVYSAVVENDQNGKMAVLAGYLNMSRGLVGAYSGAALGYRVLTAPYVVKNVGGLSSGIQVQSLTGSAQSVTIRFFNKSGTRVATTTVNAPARNSATVYLPAVAAIPDGFEGSADLTASGDIAAVVNTVRYKAS